MDNQIVVRKFPNAQAKKAKDFKGSKILVTANDPFALKEAMREHDKGTNCLALFRSATDDTPLTIIAAMKHLGATKSDDGLIYNGEVIKM